MLSCDWSSDVCSSDLFPRAVEVLEKQEEIRAEWTKGGEFWPCSFRSTNFSSSPSSICTHRNVLYHRENDIDSRPTPSLDEAIGLEYSRALPPFTTHNSRRRQVWAIFGERLAKRRFGAYVQFPYLFRTRQRGSTDGHEALATLRVRSRLDQCVTGCCVDAPSNARCNSRVLHKVSSQTTF